MRLPTLLLISAVIITLALGAGLHAQDTTATTGVISNASSGISIGSSGLLISYNVHLIIAEHWATALNATGINSTTVIKLINKAEAYASEGDYIDAITTLNSAINLATSLMASVNYNATQSVLNNLHEMTTSVNSTVINNLTNNETVVNFVIKALSSPAVNSTPGIMGVVLTALGNARTLLGTSTTPRALTGLNTAIYVLTSINNNLSNANIYSNTTAKELAFLRTELTMASLLLPANERNTVIIRIMTPRLEQLNASAFTSLRQLSMELNTTLPKPQQLTQCYLQVRELLSSLANSSTSEAYINTNELLNEYSSCLAQANALINASNTTQALIMGFINASNELNSEGLTNLTPYVLNAYNQCRYELSNAFNNGNITLIKQALEQCRLRLNEYMNNLQYAGQVMNITRGYLYYMNSTISNLARQYGISGVTPALCYVKFNNSVMSNITAILRGVLNGTITPIEAQQLINEYLNNLLNSSQSMVAGCLGINVGPPRIHVPTTTWNATLIGATGKILIYGNGTSRLIINVINPTQTTIYITGFSIGGLSCKFSSAITIGGNAHGSIEASLTMANHEFIGMENIGIFGSTSATQGITASCTGQLQSLNLPTVLNGELYLGNGGNVTFYVITMNLSNMINYGW